MPRHTALVSAACSLALLAGHAAAGESIVIRHDADDADYLALAEGHETVTILGGGSGTLVAPRWILTAAHVADSLGQFLPEVTFNGRVYQCDLVVLHPDWHDRSLDETERPDIALVRLAEPVEGVVPSPLYRESDEVGKLITFVGMGMTGNGRDGPTHDDRLLRAAHNIIDQVGYDKWLVFDFDDPREALPLEGISGPGDSGGPAFIETDGVFAVAGVSAANSGSKADGTHCTYGTTEYYARVSNNAEWLDGVMTASLNESPQDTPDTIDVTDGVWPDHPEIGLARSFFDAFNAKTPRSLGAFERRYRPDDPRERSVGERVSTWLDLRKQHGVLTPLRLAHTPGEAVHVWVDSETGNLTTLVFELRDTDPPTMTGVLLQ